MLLACILKSAAAIARAIGCVLPRSTAAATASTSCGEFIPIATTSVTTIWLLVNVPVLSSTTADKSAS